MIHTDSEELLNIKKEEDPLLPNLSEEEDNVTEAYEQVLLTDA